MEESTSRERTKGKCGDLVELPNPTLPAEELASRMLEALSERGLSQTAVCGLLALSPVYFSIWLKGKAMPETTKRLYSSACELWLADATFSVLDPALTRTNPSQVPRSKSSKPEKPEGAPPEGGSGGTGGSRQPRGVPGMPRGKERDQLASVTTPLQLMRDLLVGTGGREIAFQLHPPPAGHAGSVEAESRSLIIVHARVVCPAAVDDEEKAADGASKLKVKEEAASVAGEAAKTGPNEGGALAAEAPTADEEELRGASGDSASSRVLFRCDGAAKPFACLLPSGALRDPDDEGKPDLPALAISERPQRYRKSRQAAAEASADPELAAALEESRRSAALTPMSGGLADAVAQPPADGIAGAAAADGGGAVSDAELRRQLLSTLQTMSSEPLELRASRLRAAALEEACPALRWTAFCSVCGRHFEELDGAHQLAAVRASVQPLICSLLSHVCTGLSLCSLAIARGSTRGCTWCTVMLRGCAARSSRSPCRSCVP